MHKMILCFILALLPQLVFAWGKEGHETVGRIADANLTAKARARVATLLAGDLNAAGRPSGATTLAKVASWADDIRDNPGADQFKPWHFRNNPVCTASDGPCEHGNCINAKIDEMVATLNNAQADKKQKNQALKWLVHLVGDIHQPLHVGDNHDFGGAFAVALEMPGNQVHGGMKLHGAWDTDLVRQVLLDATMASRLAHAKLPAHYQAGNPAQWMEAGRALAKQSAYAYPGFACGGNHVGTLVLSLDYQAAARKVVAAQLEAGGLRLAALLNSVLK